MPLFVWPFCVPVGNISIIVSISNWPIRVAGFFNTENCWLQNFIIHNYVMRLLCFKTSSANNIRPGAMGMVSNTPLFNDQSNGD